MVFNLWFTAISKTFKMYHGRAQPTASRLTISGVIFFTLPSVNFNDLQIKNTSKNHHYSALSLSLNLFYQ